MAYELTVHILDSFHNLSEVEPSCLVREPTFLPLRLKKLEKTLATDKLLN